jgi:uncharacterized protein YjbK
MNAVQQKLEIEIKLKLECFPDYLKLVGFLGNPDSEEHQINAFFDSEAHTLLKSGWGLRVRAENNRGLVTLKGSSGTDVDMAVIREEIEEEVSRGLALAIINLETDILSVEVSPIAQIRTRYPDLAPARLVRFENQRLCKHHRIGDYQYLFELDKTEFADGSCDYELEMEVEQQEQVGVVVESLRRLFASLNIPFERQPETKFARALARTGRF